jgi:hypothetical protein
MPKKWCICFRIGGNGCGTTPGACARWPGAPGCRVRRYTHGMRMVHGKVLDGRVVVDGDLPEGARVTVVIEDNAAVELNPEDEAELAERLAAAQRGETIEYSSIDDMLRDVCQ